MIYIKNNIKKFLFLDNNDFKLTLYRNGVHIVNYNEIKTFDDNKIIIEISDKKIEIKGKNLTTKKLIKDEILIEGKINSIEIG